MIKIKKLYKRIIVPYMNYYLRMLSHKSVAHPDKIIYIKTDDIKYWYLQKPRRLQGSVIKGDWDKNVIHRDDILIRKEVDNWQDVSFTSQKYYGLKQHFEDGVPWGGTVLFQYGYTKRLQKGRIKAGSNISEVVRYYERYDKLYEVLKKDGFIQDYNRTNIKPIYVYINRHGDLLYTSNGNHRLGIAIILGIDEIPVKVWCRHHEWQLIRSDYFSLSPSDRIKKYPKLIGHPDLRSEKT